MSIEDSGYSDKLEKLKIELKLDGFEIGRVISEHRELYTAKTINRTMKLKLPETCVFWPKAAKIFLQLEIGSLYFPAS